MHVAVFGKFDQDLQMKINKQINKYSNGFSYLEYKIGELPNLLLIRNTFILINYNVIMKQTTKKRWTMSFTLSL